MGGSCLMYLKNVLTQIAYDFDMELYDLCFAVSTESFDFPFSFFAFEDDEILGIFVTDEAGAEKLHVIVKSQIVYIKIHYLDELELLMCDTEAEKLIHGIYN